MLFSRRYSVPGVEFGGVKFVQRDSRIKTTTGAVVFEHTGIWVPEQWSQTAVDILAQKYMRKAGVPSEVETVQEKDVPEWLRRRVPASFAGRTTALTFGRETDARQVFRRLAGAWTYEAWKNGYFGKNDYFGDKYPPDEADRKITTANALTFFDELCAMLAQQVFAPNSPQWFNTGLYWAYGIEADGQTLFRVRDAIASGPTEALPGDVTQISESYRHPMSYACFIQTVEDCLIGGQGIMSLTAREAKVFKFGGGSGSNFSALRGEGEPLTAGGQSSGLMSWLGGYDRFAGAIKSGGTTRRAAKMIIVDDDHPDLLAFINWKVREEDKVAMLAAGSVFVGNYAAAIASAVKDGPEIDKNPKLKSAVAKALRAGVPGPYVRRVLSLARSGRTVDVPVYDTDWQGEAYRTVGGQNANNTVRVTNEFMANCLTDAPHHLYWRTEKEKAQEAGRKPKPCKTLTAKQVWDAIIEAAWKCADPGINFAGTMAEWNTVANDGEIRATNPCQPAFATVLTPNGVRTFGDIDVGSTIWTGRRWTTVTRKVATGNKPVYRYVTAAGSFIGTAEHRVFQRGERVEVHNAEFIDTALGPVPTSPAQISESIVYGLMIGDGYIKESGELLYPLLCVGDKDQDYFTDKAVAEYIEHTPFDTKAHRALIVVRQEDFPHLPQRRIPERFRHGSAEVVCSFLRGLYSANGSICGGRVTLKTTSPRMRDDVQEMLASVGIRSYFTTNKACEVEFDNGVYECRESYDINITVGKNLFRQLIGFIQKDKLARLDEACQHSGKIRKTCFEVRETQSLGVHPVWDITVADEDHAYWTGGLLVSNCSEFAFLDDTGCNLASVNLVTFLQADGTFDFPSFQHACRLVTVVLDITVDMSSYPSPEIAKNAHNYRTLGLGYCNLGGLLMRSGIPYDSDDGRRICAAITCLMHSEALCTSAQLAHELGSFPRFAANREHAMRVIHNHAALASETRSMNTEGLSRAHYWLEHGKLPDRWQQCGEQASIRALEALRFAGAYGVRNAQVTNLAPTGTIGPLMDADTTGIEPDFALVKFKSLAGGGYFKIVNQGVPAALHTLGYTTEQIADVRRHINGSGWFNSGDGAEQCPHFDKLVAKYGAAKISESNLKIGAALDVSFILDGVDKVLTSAELTEVNRYVCGHMTIEGAPHVKPEDLPVFDCANKCGTGSRYLAWQAHVDMMCAAQSWISGGISKTINLPADATQYEMSEAYLRAWHKGGKCISLYRDESKLSQPLSGGDSLSSLTTVTDVEEIKQAERIITKIISTRRAMPNRRGGYTQKARVGPHKLYLRTGEYEDGTLGEIFVDLHKEGASFRSLMNCFCIAVSLGLQHGVGLDEFVDKFTFQRFEPYGIVQHHPRLKNATSIVDFIFRDLAITYLGRDDLAHVSAEDMPPALDAASEERDRAADYEPRAVAVDRPKSTHVALSGAQRAKIVTARDEARQKGYTGNFCHACGNCTMVRSGNCERCDSCADTSGCS